MRPTDVILVYMRLRTVSTVWLFIHSFSRDAPPSKKNTRRMKASKIPSKVFASPAYRFRIGNQTASDLAKWHHRQTPRLNASIVRESLRPKIHTCTLDLLYNMKTYNGEREQHRFDAIDIGQLVKPAQQWDCVEPLIYIRTRAIWLSVCSVYG